MDSADLAPMADSADNGAVDSADADTTLDGGDGAVATDGAAAGEGVTGDSVDAQPADGDANPADSPAIDASATDALGDASDNGSVDAADGQGLDASADGGLGDAVAEVQDGGPVCPATCSDGNACTDDSCVAGLCVNLPSTQTACDDMNPCTLADSCVNKVCTGVAVKCPGNGPCLVGASCNPADGSCGLASSATGTACDDGNVCTTDSCSAATGCVFANEVTGTTCVADSCGANGKTYTPKSVCNLGSCAPSKAATVCDDNNPCTDNFCDAAKGCSYSNNTVTCNDGVACTDSDVCKNGSCAGSAKVCNDNNPCTSDSCANGSCAYTNIAASTTTCSGQIWNNHCYEAVTKAAGIIATDAEAACKAAGGNLVSIHSVEENAIVLAQATAVCKANAHIGGTKVPNSVDAIVWNDGTPVMFTNWSPGEPNNAKEKYTEMLTTGLWNDGDGTARTCYVCERLLSPACTDNNACTVGDACAAGKCAGLAATCQATCKSYGQCNATGGCGTATPTTHSTYSPAFCDAGQSLTCGAGVCTSKASTCGSKSCGYDGNLSDCGKCAPASVCLANSTCAAKTSYPGPNASTLLPGGAFTVGCSTADGQCDSDEKPQHMVYISPLYLDNCEASYGEYKACVAASKCTAIDKPPVADSLAVNRVTYAQALAYCAYRGGSLPTSAQWEFAARYNAVTGLATATTYRWGNSWPPPLGAIPGNLNAGINDGYAGVAPANTLVGIDVVPGTSIYHLNGNLREWTKDRHYSFYATSPVLNPVASNTAYGGIVVRGGSYLSINPTAAQFNGRISSYDWYYDNDSPKDDMGVRCAYPFTK